MRNIGYSDTALLTADGCVEAVGELVGEGCCPIDPCMVDACSLMCSFISLLPNGPLWDRAKVERMSRYEQEPCGPACLPASNDCASVVDYAIYSGYQLDYLIKGPLWSALREANPDTAVETLDSWLELYGWTDGWESLCRDRRLGPSPFECGVFDPPLNACDANFSPIHIPEVPAKLDLAVKRGIVRALSRLQMSPIKSLCGINWVIEPLGAVLRPSSLLSGQCCTSARWEICNLSDTIEGVPPKQCADGVTASPVQAWFPMKSLVFNPTLNTCVPTGEPLRIWPGILAAQIIALSLMPTARDCSQFISRCTELGDMPYAAAGDFARGVYMLENEQVPAATAWTFARATTGGYFDADGVWQTAAINVPRFEHSPQLNNALVGLLFESGRTNRILQSNALTTAPWTSHPVAGVTVVADDVSIFGGTLWRITSNTVGYADWRQNFVMPVINTQYTMSGVFKRGNTPDFGFKAHVLAGVGNPNGTAQFDARYNFDTDTLTAVQSGNPLSGTLIEATRVKYPTGEVRISLSVLPLNDGNAFYVLINPDANGESVQAGHIQVEQSSTLRKESSLISTTVAAATRQADNLTINATGVNDWTLTFADGSTQTIPNVNGNLVLTTGLITVPDVRHIVSYIAQ